MNKAFVTLNVKAIDGEQRVVEGWATRAEQDRVGDIVLPRGAVYKLPLPFLLDHDHSKAVGQVDRVEVTDSGIRFWAHIPRVEEDGELKRLTDYAWSLVKTGLRKAVSIGFRVLESEPITNSRGIKVRSWEWLELSAVSVPCLASAQITGVKSYGSDYVTVSHDSVGAVRLITHKPGEGSVRLGR
ncbi:peptidase U35 [Advenella kashmirensis W13003]|uniref:Peptidase U35 n=1 Tax=Advenella kashmirensis W13003 TaxID=1424334 RepID=V8QR97_9BURK|nr:HK97 family phage prohead protease [Advenella kashmirensis]ETF02152.1 peptidase U35 [Advenella kashmirensis W13003]